MTETEISIEPTAFDQLHILLESLDQHPDAAVRDHFRALAYTLLDLHHGAFQRIVEIVSARPGGAEILQDLEADELVRAVLLVHELTPQPFEARVETGLENAREKLAVYSADVELVSLKNGVARLRILGGAATANVSTALLKSEIEGALHEAAPDLLDVEYEEIIAPIRPPKLVQIKPRETGSQISSNEVLIPIIRVNQVPNHGFRVVAMSDVNLVFCNIENKIYCFDNCCPKHNVSFEGGVFEAGVLACSEQNCQYDVQRGGRSLTDPDLRLVAEPFKVENETVKIALPSGV